LRKTRAGITSIILLLIILPFNSYGQDADPVVHKVKIRNYAFVPEVLNINIGDSVLFIWEDGAFGHNVEQVGNSKDTSYDSGGFRSGDPENGPSQWTLPNSYTQENITLFYICGPHVLSHNMRGKINVGEGSADTSESGANVTLLLAIFLGSGIFMVIVIALLQKQKKSI
jgi:plastocyanin